MAPHDPRVADDPPRRDAAWRRSRVPRSVSTEPATPRRRPTPSILTFVVTYVIVLVYAVRGGSFDLVARDEVAIAIWWSVGLGWVCGLLPRARPPRGAVFVLATLAAMAAWTAAGLAWTESAERTTADLSRVIGYIGLVALLVSVLDQHTWRALLAALMAGAGTVVLLAAISRLHPGWFPHNYVKGTLANDRLSYPFNYWNSVAAFAAMTIAGGLVWSAHARSTVVRGLALATVPVAGLVIYLAYSRGGAAGAALGTIAAIGLSRNRWTVAVHAVAGAGTSTLAILAARGHPGIIHAGSGAGGGEVAAVLVAGAGVCGAVVVATRRARADARWRLPPRGGRIATVAMIAVVVIGGFASGVPSRAWDNFRRPVAAAASTDPASHFANLNGGRYQQWQAAWEAFSREPLHGSGSGTFEFTWNTDKRYTSFIRDVHSLYLEALTEQGIVGFLLLLTFIAASLAAAAKARRRTAASDEFGVATAALAVFVVYLFHAGIEWLWESTTVTVFAIAGVAAAAMARAEPVSPLLQRRPVRLVAGVTALVAVAALLPALVATVATRRSAEAVRGGRLEVALRRASDAVASEPWAATPRLQRALVLERLGELDAAAIDASAAASREPRNWRFPLALARIEAERGDARAAVTDFRRARGLNPKDPALRG